MLAMLVVLGSVAIAQRPPVLEEPKAVDVRVERFDWHPDGSALAYTRMEDEKGRGIGLYRVGDEEGKVLVHLKEGDTYESQWMEGTQALILIVYRKMQESNQADIYVLNAKNRTAEQVYSKQSSERLDVDVDPSPSLLHAIFRIKEGKERHHFVLPLQGGRLRPSSDLDQAVDAGYFGPLWSVDGTAIYQKGAASASDPALDKMAVAIQARDKAEFELLQLKGGEITVQGEALMAEKVRAELVLRFRPIAPPAGTPVMEVVPANGVLRQVRFQGEWQEQAKPQSLNSTKAEPRTLEFRGIRGEARSLWIVVGKDKNTAPATYVASHAQLASLAPNDKAIGYVTDSALFVRRFVHQR